MSRILLIGIGNTTRSDDAVGSRVVEGVAGRHPDVECLSVQQLVPELAERMVAADLVVFVDASLDAGRVRMTEVSASHPMAGAHLTSPASLLSLCELAYGRRPGRCLLVEIPVRALGFGEGLSREAIVSVEEATGVVERLVISARPSS